MPDQNDTLIKIWGELNMQRILLKYCIAQALKNGPRDPLHALQVQKGQCEKAARNINLDAAPPHIQEAVIAHMIKSNALIFDEIEADFRHPDYPWGR